MKLKILGLIFFMTGKIIFAENISPKKLYNFYAKTSLDIATQYFYALPDGSGNSEYLHLADPEFVKGDGFGYSFDIQGTYNISDKAEIGIGLGYISPAQSSEVKTKQDLIYKYPTYTATSIYFLGKYKFLSENYFIVPYLQMETGFLFADVGDDGLPQKEYSEINIGYIINFLAGAEFGNIVTDFGITSRWDWLSSANKIYILRQFLMLH
ncbi:MAG: hypothetical protein ACRCSK_04720 [Fusobacteriaceae bacterium]